MRKHVRLAALAGPLILAGCSELDSPTQPEGIQPQHAQAPGGAAQGSYIFVFREGVTDVPGLARQLVTENGGELGFTYEHAIRGFSARLPAAAVEGLRRHPLIAGVEADQEFTISTTQTGATWGIDRIDQRNLPLSTSYTYDATGSGVNAYIIDTGIRSSHTEFGGRASSGFTSISDGRGTDDCNGHGTHVAGTVGGTTYGVAKGVSLIAVRVLSCQGSGTTSGVIAGVDWVTGKHVKPAVANMSLGGGASSTLDDAVNNSIAAGVIYAVAAGNSNANACNYSPARAANAITVGATTSTDARASYSNYGSCLDIFAPGSSITSAWYSSTTATNTISGTSMASPHVAGVAALYLQGSPGANPAAVTSAITSNATLGKVGNAGTGSPNALLYMGFFGGSGNQAPAASFTYSCTGLTCSFNGSGSNDPDGSITTFAWTFGDGTSGSGVTPNKTYSSAGTRTVILTVTDNGGLTGTQSQTVTTTAPSTGINLTVSMSKTRGINSANLSWTGAGTSVDVYRNNAKIATQSGTTYSDDLGRGGGTATYHVCNNGTSTCSNSVTVSY